MLMCKRDNDSIGALFLPKTKCTHVYIYIHTYAYIRVYRFIHMIRQTERGEREKEKNRKRERLINAFSLSVKRLSL